MPADRVGGPPDVKRPYKPGPGIINPAERQAEALDHIAVVLSAIDDTLERLTFEVVTFMAARRSRDLR